MIVHIAGLDVMVGPHLRQRCAWCGAVLIDEDQRMIAVPVGQAGGGRTAWRVGALVARDGHIWWTLEHADGDVLPEGCCGKLDPTVTV